MIARKRGAILNVSSSAGFLPIPEAAVYAASKAYVTSFSEALRTELHGTRRKVTALCPGPVQRNSAKWRSERASKENGTGDRACFGRTSRARRA